MPDPTFREIVSIGIIAFGYIMVLFAAVGAFFGLSGNMVSVLVVIGLVSVCAGGVSHGEKIVMSGKPLRRAPIYFLMTALKKVAPNFIYERACYLRYRRGCRMIQRFFPGMYSEYAPISFAEWCRTLKEPHA